MYSKLKFSYKHKTRWKMLIKSYSLILLILLIINSCAKSQTPKDELTKDSFSDYQSGLILNDLAEDLSIGIKEGDENYVLFKPTDIVIDSDSNIYILDSSIECIRKYNSNGIFTKNIGNKGQGPGEFLQLKLIEIQDDNIFALDDMLRKIEIIDLHNYNSRSIRFRHEIDRFVPLQNEKIYIGYFSQIKDNSGKYKRIYLINLYDRIEGLETPIFSGTKFRKQIILKEILNNRTLIISTAIVYPWATNSLNHLYLLDLDEDKVIVISSSGSVLFKFNCYLIATNSKKNDFLDHKKRTKRDILNSRYIPEYIIVDDVDRVWVLFTPNLDKKSPNEITYFNVFSSEGKYLFSTKLNEKIYFQPVIKRNYLYFITYIKDDYPAVKRARLN